MTGTTDLTREQFDTIAREVEAGFTNLGDGRVDKVVITPVTGSHGAVKVTFAIVGYGNSWIVVERDGGVPAREHSNIDVAELVREAISEYVARLGEDHDPHNDRLKAVLEDVWVETDGTWGT